MVTKSNAMYVFMKLESIPNVWKIREAHLLISVTFSIFFSFTHINQEKKNVTTNDDVNAVAWIEGASPFDCWGDIVGGGGFGSVLQQILSLPLPCGQQNLPSPRSWNL